MKSLVIAVLVLMASPAFADRAPPPPWRIENGTLVMPEPVAFETGSANLKPGVAIDFVRAFLEAKSDITVLRIEAHVSGALEPQALSEARALAIGRALVAAGADCKRLLAVGFGDTKPVAPNDTPEGRAANTRTSFMPAALRGRAIGGMPLDGGGRVAGDLCAAP